MSFDNARRNPKFPDYIAVDHLSIPIAHRIGPTGSPCGDCPSRECDDKGSKACPIDGVWMSISNVVALRLAGVDVRLSDVDRKLNLEKFK